MQPAYGPLNQDNPATGLLHAGTFFERVPERVSSRALQSTGSPRSSYPPLVSTSAPLSSNRALQAAPSHTTHYSFIQPAVDRVDSYNLRRSSVSHPPTPSGSYHVRRPSLSHPPTPTSPGASSQGGRFSFASVMPPTAGTPSFFRTGTGTISAEIPSSFDFRPLQSTRSRSYVPTPSYIPTPIPSSQTISMVPPGVRAPPTTPLGSMVDVQQIEESEDSSDEDDQVWDRRRHWAMILLPVFLLVCLVGSWISVSVHPWKKSQAEKGEVLGGKAPSVPHEEPEQHQSPEQPHESHTNPVSKPSHPSHIVQPHVAPPTEAAGARTAPPATKPPTTTKRTHPHTTVRPLLPHTTRTTTTTTSTTSTTTRRTTTTTTTTTTRTTTTTTKTTTTTRPTTTTTTTTTHRTHAPTTVAPTSPQPKQVAVVNSGAPFIGVNLGGWLVLESWIWAAEMEDKGIKDEWSLVKAHGGPGSMNAIQLIQNHRASFLTESDLDRLVSFGVTHVRIPVGWWLVDFSLADGFVDGGKHFLTRALGWMKARNIRALLDMHCLPGAQAAGQGYTGKIEASAGFFVNWNDFNRGKQALRKLAELILEYEESESTSGVIFGMELVNEPEWSSWWTTPGQRQLYEEMIPSLRKLLPSHRYALYINPQEGTPHESVLWLQGKRNSDPGNYENVVFDIHVYHSFGDDNAAGHPHWKGSEDSCKTCCRDRARLGQLVQAEVPIAVGEYSLTTGFPGNDKFYADFMHEQLSLWQNTERMQGSFFWNFRVLPQRKGWYKEFSLLDLYGDSLKSVRDVEFSEVCPSHNLEKCPKYSIYTVGFQESCSWA